MSDDGWIRTDRGWRKSYGPPAQTTSPGSYPCPRVVTDTMPLTEHVDGKHYDSKSAYRRVTKERGYVEIGNDPARLRRPEKPKVDKAANRDAVKKAMAQVIS